MAMIVNAWIVLLVRANFRLEHRFPFTCLPTRSHCGWFRQRVVQSSLESHCMLQSDRQWFVEAKATFDWNTSWNRGRGSHQSMNALNLNHGNQNHHEAWQILRELRRLWACWHQRDSHAPYAWRYDCSIQRLDVGRLDSYTCIEFCPSFLAWEATLQFEADLGSRQQKGRFHPPFFWYHPRCLVCYFDRGRL